jgi:Spy/CpxP family protein refolding chaperone
MTSVSALLLSAVLGIADAGAAQSPAPPASGAAPAPARATATPGAPDEAHGPVFGFAAARAMPAEFGSFTAGSVDFLTAPLNVMGRLFPPSLIMRNQSDIDLTDQQADRIKASMREFQGQVVDVQWDLQTHQSRLDQLLEADQIDAAAADAAIDQVLASENALKKAHLGMLIAIRNALTAEQIATLEKAQRNHFFVQPLTAPMPPVPPDGGMQFNWIERQDR